MKVTDFKDLRKALNGELDPQKGAEMGRTPLDVGNGITVTRWAVRRTKDERHYDFAGTKINYEGRRYTIKRNGPHNMIVERDGIERQLRVGNDSLVPYFLGEK